ncbi:MAG: ATP-binding cassette domain-containing protein [Planctomycetes bacterium]|nr:ATP-binding cassette domain-containing protein [Planctomycetota bacterium]
MRPRKGAGRVLAGHSLENPVSIVLAENLTKTFRVPQREPGLGAALRAVLRRKYTDVQAVAGVSFSIEPGEIVGFLGPNGAGKTTTLKMLTGLLHPTAGSAIVMGHVPWKREREYLRRVSLVMGQRSKLNWDLPAMDSFLVQLAIYDVPESEGRKTIDELVELLELGPLLKKPVRNLSLGERMKCELCVSLLHRPQVLFLDEPTIGVDITMQARIRHFIADYNRRGGATVILTSHYMADVTALCRRIIVINHGRILFDGPLVGLVERMAPFKLIAIDLERDLDGVSPERYGELVSRDARKLTLRVPKDAVAAATSRLLAELPVLDLTVQDPPIEDVIANVFHVKQDSPL